MKHFYSYLLCIITFVMPCILHAPIKELSQLQQSLQKLTEFLGKSQISTPPPVKTPIIETQLNNYEELIKVVQDAKKVGNTTSLDKYKQTVMVATAKYLLQEYFKEQTVTGKDSDYIPFIAYMTQQVVEQYPDKNTSLNCVSLDRNYATDSVLENEFLLIRALVHNGYKNITIIPMNLWYHSFDSKRFPMKFNNWVDANITSALKDHIVLRLLNKDESEYTYISDIKNNKISKNNLFFMINSGGRNVQEESKSKLLAALTPTFTSIPNINFFSFEEAQASNRIKIYMPYDPSDIFIKSTIPDTKEKVDNLQQTIKNSDFVKYQIYQQNLINFLIKNSYDSILGTDIARGRFGVDIDLFFLDLIKHTAIDPTKPLAFVSLQNVSEMTQITNMSGTLEEVYMRYQR